MDTYSRRSRAGAARTGQMQKTCSALYAISIDFLALLKNADICSVLSAKHDQTCTQNIS